MVLISVYDSSFLPIFSLYLREELRLEPFPLIGIEKDSIREIKSYKACNFKSDVTKIYKCCTLLDKFNFWDMKINEFEKRYLKKNMIEINCSSWEKVFAPCTNDIIHFFHPQLCK